jgi:type I restriction enzyme M protein
VRLKLYVFERIQFESRDLGSLASEDTVLFLDARNIFRQIDRAHREFTPEQVEFLVNIVRLYRGKELEFDRGSEKLLKEHFGASSESPKNSGRRVTPPSEVFAYHDVPGLCRAAKRTEIEAQG